MSRFLNIALKMYEHLRLFLVCYSSIHNKFIIMRNISYFNLLYYEMKENLQTSEQSLMTPG